MWGTTDLAKISGHKDLFQSTCPCGARPLVVRTASNLDGVSIHVPVWGTTRNQSHLHHYAGFNPRARVGHDKNRLTSLSVGLVSIHVPVWGTTLRAMIRYPENSFQSTCPCGARRNRSATWFNSSVVSIHVPVWGTTRLMASVIGRTPFQSTCPCGARPMFRYMFGAHKTFQSTCPCGARRGYFFEYCQQAEFQSTCPCGARPFRSYYAQHPCVSIHVPVWGTTEPQATLIMTYMFQSTCPCGARPTLLSASITMALFQSTCPCGARLLAELDLSPLDWFQSTCPCGARLC